MRENDAILGAFNELGRAKYGKDWTEYHTIEAVASEKDLNDEDGAIAIDEFYEYWTGHSEE